ncbi:MAG: response regulator [Desulfobacterales bacterium]|nr:response regulator [Desulfobacterales bacterium]
MNFITTSKASKICGVARTTISKWIDEGALKAFVTPGGHRKVREEDLMDFLEKNGIRPSAEPRAKRCILIVDDNPDDIRLLEAAFLPASDKYELHSASGGFQAIYKIGEIKPHIVILDAVMPDMDGFKVCESIKNNPETRDTKIIIVTAYHHKVNEKKACRCGADAFFHKPIDLKRLVEKILEFSRVAESSPLCASEPAYRV